MFADDTEMHDSGTSLRTNCVVHEKICIRMVALNNLQLELAIHLSFFINAYYYHLQGSPQKKNHLVVLSKILT